MATEEQIQAHLDALASEKAGYEAKVAEAESVNDTAKAKLYTGRVSQVDAEIKSHSPAKGK